jgi:hypothetical protein
MRSNFKVLAIMTVTAATSVAAQPPSGGMAGDRSAQLLLARSAELGLTDAQVVKLAAIARRAEARRAPMRAAMDSARTRFTQPGDSGARRQFAQRMQNDMTKERDQARVDLRDAITVLTPDQQAKAWEMSAARGSRGGAMRGGAMRGGRPGRDGAMRGGRGMGMPRDGARGGAGPGRRPDGMGPGGQMGPGNQVGPGGGMPGQRGAMPRRPRPEFDGFPSERNPE